MNLQLLQGAAPSTYFRLSTSLTASGRMARASDGAREIKVEWFLENHRMSSDGVQTTDVLEECIASIFRV
jgi:hypothetical protein